MVAKWFEEYQKLSRKTRFISQLAAFLISVFSLLSIYDIARIVMYHEPQFLKGLTETELFEFWISMIFQILIFTIFVLRFSLLFFKSSKSFWLSQGLSFVGLILFAVYLYISIPPKSEVSFGIYGTYPAGFSKYASLRFDTFGICYLVLSPIRQIITLIHSYLKFRRSKI